MGRGIIIVGHCRSGKVAMMQQVLKERPVLVGLDIQDMESSVRKLKMAFEATVMSSKEEIEELKQALERACFNIQWLKNVCR
jgi:SUMO ligase MMS21 Smc5/6 complex component